MGEVFVVSYNDNNEIVGVLGFDIDEISESAEIWGLYYSFELGRDCFKYVEETYRENSTSYSKVSWILSREK